MFVNELSLELPASDVASAQERISQFVGTVRAAAERGVQRALRTPENFLATQLASNYNWHDWLRDTRVSRELRQYFRLLSTKAPFLRDTPDMESEWRSIDCRWQNQLTLGLKAAYVTDGLAISIASRDEWNLTAIKCQVEELTDEDISSRTEEVHHASFWKHLESHTDWIHDRIRTSVKDGASLWVHATTFFPCLEYCDSVEEQMVNLPQESLSGIIRGLFRLNAFCLIWKSGPFEPDKIPCTVSVESPSTLQMFGDERSFLCPDGVKRAFSWHAKLGRRWRIHFDPAPGPGKLLIGYVGKHLRIASQN